MDVLYHRTNQLIMEIEESFQKLSRLKESSADTNSVETEISAKINLVKE